jgi:hypothetical protein
MKTSLVLLTNAERNTRQFGYIKRTTAPAKSYGTSKYLQPPLGNQDELLYSRLVVIVMSLRGGDTDGGMKETQMADRGTSVPSVPALMLAIVALVLAVVLPVQLQARPQGTQVFREYNGQRVTQMGWFGGHQLSTEHIALLWAPSVITSILNL